MRLSALLDQIAVDLNDAAPGHVYTTWHRDQIRAYLEEAIQVAFTNRPDLFTATRIMKVQNCNVVQQACDCTKIRRVIGQSTKDGRLIKPLRRLAGNDNLRWQGRMCPAYPDDFELNDYSIDNKMDKVWVFPAVPPTLDIYVLVECSIVPENLDDSYEIPAELVAAVRQWALWLAKIVDGENNALIVDVAQKHQETFWRLLAAQKEDEDFRAEKDDARSTTRSGV